ncbi:hypothetical protein TBK1r_64500 [Stieleria magnilauensis]|uniref:HEAT repeat domain-containing protein n=1 Tax=Stieleria magnilauensis TaxID=2527963 RepID=A0ABX5XZF5_9BACT|nr:hypothetical protein TBK1r_64500 [Planctomycetes bacterium TBK1r]
MDVVSIDRRRWKQNLGGRSRDPTICCGTRLAGSVLIESHHRTKRRATKFWRRSIPAPPHARIDRNSLLDAMNHDFAYVEKVFSSTAPKRNCIAAAKLRNLGGSGRHLLPVVFRLCREIDLDGELDQAELGFLLSAVRSIGCVINSIGFDPTDDLHVEFVDWTISLTHCSNNEVRAISIWTLGDLGIPPQSVHERLIDLVRSDRFSNDHELTTCRSIAFRMLARVSRESAANFVSTEACKEYIQSMDLWLHRNAERPNGHYDRGPELEAEIAWLRVIRAIRGQSPLR